MTKRVFLSPTLADFGVTQEAITEIHNSPVTPESWEKIADMWAAAAASGIITESDAVERVQRCWNIANRLRQKSNPNRERE